MSKYKLSLNKNNGISKASKQKKYAVLISMILVM